MMVFSFFVLSPIWRPGGRVSRGLDQGLSGAGVRRLSAWAGLWDVSSAFVVTTILSTRLSSIAEVR